ncbi:MAG: hypothetical protein ACRD6W_01735, partial [Nitrososphaerales archaeon]
MRADAGRIRPFVFAAGIPEARLHELIGEALPGSRLEPAHDDPAIEGTGGRLRLVSLTPAAGEQAPFATRFASDPIGLLLRSLGSTPPGAAAVVQLLVTGAPRRARTRLLADAARLRAGNRRRPPIERVFSAFVYVVRAVWELFDSATTVPARTAGPPQLGWVDRERVQALTEKAGEPLFACSLRLAAVAPTGRLARALVTGLRDDFEQYTSQFNHLRRGVEPSRRRR